MKNLLILPLLFSLLLVNGCMGVPSNRITIKAPTGSYHITTPKNVAIEKFSATVQTNGLLQITFDKWSSTNDALVIDKAAAGDALRINALSALVDSGIATGIKAAKAP